MATAIETEQGLRAWAQVLDELYRTGVSSGLSAEKLDEAYVHVQRDSNLGRWMYEISKQIDQSTLEVITYWNLLDYCRAAAGEVCLDSDFGVWMREMSYRNL